jgi:hypothetical protein
MSVYVDERVRYVGVSKLRKFNATSLRGLRDELFVIQDSDEPIAVLLSYGLYMQTQKLIGEREAGAGSK